MEIKRNSKKFNINIDDTFNLKYGSFNKNKPIVIFITAKTWFKPLTKDMDSIIKDIESINKKEIIKYIDSSVFDESKFIFGIDLAKKQLLQNKKSFLTFELFIVQKNNFRLDDEVIVKSVEKLSKGIINLFKNKLDNKIVLNSKKISIS